MFLHLSPLWGMTFSLIGDFNAVGMKGMGERLRQESSAGSLVLCLFSKTASYIWRHKPGSTHTQMRRTDVHTQTHTQTCTHCGLRQLSEHTKMIYSCVDTRGCRHIVVIDAHTHTIHPHRQILGLIQLCTQHKHVYTHTHRVQKIPVTNKKAALR